MLCFTKTCVTAEYLTGLVCVPAVLFGYSGCTLGTSASQCFREGPSPNMLWCEANLPANAAGDVITAGTKLPLSATAQISFDVDLTVRRRCQTYPGCLSCMHTRH